VVVDARFGSAWAPSATFGVAGRGDGTVGVRLVACLWRGAVRARPRAGGRVSATTS